VLNLPRRLHAILPTVAALLAVLAAAVVLLVVFANSTAVAPDNPQGCHRGNAHCDA
jgi:hypothetical protein